MNLNRILFAIVLVITTFGIMNAQNTSIYSNKRAEKPLLSIKGSVLDTETLQPISKVNVEVVGGDYTATNNAGDFTIRARVGDELVIRNAGFETVYYTIVNDQRIRVEVRPVDIEVESDAAYDIDLKKQKKQRQSNYDDYMQLAKSNYKKDASIGLDYVASALEDKKISTQQRAAAFALLGDIYIHWKQHDLGVTNYRLSLRNKEDLKVKIDLARAYYLNKNYQECIELSQNILKDRLSQEKRLLIKEGLADAYEAIGDNQKARELYEELAKESTSIQDKAYATRANTKLANNLERSGNALDAEGFIEEALEITQDQKIDDAARTKLEAANYYNRNKSYDEEIALRKEVLNDLEEVSLDSISNDDALTPQKQNYKIASAYVAQNKLDDAIPFFERSIEEAENKEDIIVAKDATRRLSEVFRDKGDFESATVNYERYMSLVDQDYILKEQELSRSQRFVKDLSEKQNRIASLEKDRALNETRYQLAFNEQELASSRNLKQNIIIGSLALVTLLLLITAFAMYRSSKQQKYANNLLALKGLRSQMNPHFIFNALNSVNSFIAANDELTANKYLSDFSILMRSVLENSEEDFIPLSKEIALIEKYVMLEHFRFKDKFDYTLEVDPALDIEAFEIPPMLLQPYVENAVWHGMRYKEEKGLLQIHFGQKDANTAIITVTDDGVGRKKSKALKTDNQKKQKSKGMSNIKNRISILNEMYGDRVDVLISDVYTTGEGTKVSLTLKKE